MHLKLNQDHVQRQLSFEARQLITETAAAQAQFLLQLASKLFLASLALQSILDNQVLTAIHKNK